MTKKLSRLNYLLLSIFLISCNPNQPEHTNMLAEFLYSRELPGYPSGSTISYFNERFYIMGDDASTLLVLNSALKVVENVPLFIGSDKRIAKDEKADIESSEWLISEDKAKLWLFSSGSLSPQRDSAFCLDPKTGVTERISLQAFYRKLKIARIKELNIEAAASVGNSLLFGSRGNASNTQNYLVKTSADSFRDGTEIKLLLLNIPTGAGVSGMSYWQQEDILLITTSEENTQSAYEDGEIGESSLGFVHNISKKLSGGPITPVDWISLSALHPDFNGQKIESVCSQQTEHGEATVTFVSDDDKGGTRLFQVKLKRENGR